MLTFLDPLVRAARCFGDSLAVVDGPVRLTFGELDDRVRRLVGALRSLGVAPGDRVAVLGDNSHQYLELLVAVPAMGAVVVPLNTRLAPVELAELVADCRPRLLFTDRGDDDVAAVAGDVRVVGLGTDLDELLARTAPERSIARPHEDDLAVIFYTGGTTGRSKGVMLSHRNKISDTWNLMAAVGLSPADRWLIVGPMFHASGTFNVLACIWSGAASVVHPRFDARAMVDTIEREAITVTFAVPTMLVAMAAVQAERRADLSSLRLLGHGASPITETDLATVCAAVPGAEVMAMYGATELAPMATTYSHQERDLGSPRFRSCGRPVLGVDLRVVDDDGVEVPNGVVGEVSIEGPNVMLGYWDRPEETSAVLTGRRYRTGDLGWLDDEGFLYLVDRKKDMIITGGENVYSTEVESVIAAAAGVVEVAVIGLPDPRWGERVCAVVVASQPIDVDELRRGCRERLAGYKVPKEVRVQVEPLPRTPAGKVLKRELRDRVLGVEVAR